MALRYIPRDASCLSLKLEYDNMCDVCKTKHIAISQGFKPRSKKACSCPWQPETVAGKRYSMTLIKHKQIIANMQDLGYRADNLVDKEIISPVFTK